MKELRIVVLDDNVPAPGLRNDWGWSAYIDMGEKAVLFDADTRPNIIEHNINKLNIDVEKIEFAVLSHMHGDHYGGFQYIGRVKPGLKIYVPSSGVDFLKKWGLEPIIINEPLKISDDIWISGPLKSSPFGIREQALGIRVDDVGLVIIVGCSHPGVDRLSMRLSELFGEEVFLVIGGYHNPSRKALDNLAQISKYICPTHCSGDAAKKYVRKKYPDKYFEIRTGTKITTSREGLKVD
ncbi:MAG: MBL fold metallo-hydrolase [Candidatus Njordarchaeota archaeon]